MRLVKATEITTLPRGRKAEFDGALLDVLAQIKGDNFGVLDEEFGSVVDKTERAKVAGVIRKHWAKVHGETRCTIRWSVDGFAQVGAAK